MTSAAASDTVDLVRRRVIKLGGSLLEHSGLPERFRAWRNRQSAAATLVVVGGGEMANCIRRADRIHQLGDQAAHWLAVDTLGVTASLFAALHDEAIQTSSWTEALRLTSMQPDRVHVVNVAEFLRNVDSQSASDLPALKAGWQVTSDSIAVQVAKRWQADELVLLKSASAPSNSLAEWRRADYVDAAFCDTVGPQATFVIRAVNLRSANFAEQSWRSCQA